MSRIFAEFENENALRDYPFASGCTCRDSRGLRIDPGTLVDAALYPVNPSGRVYLSRISADGTVSVSDSHGVVMTAAFETGSSRLDFYGASGVRRHAGTMVASSPEALEALVRVHEPRTFGPDATSFAASCVFPVVNDGVLSVDVQGTGAMDGTVEFVNGPYDPVRVSTDAEGSTLRFDVLPPRSAQSLSSIRHVFCVVDGKTPFRIMKLPFGDEPRGNGNTVVVYLDSIDRQDICGDAHRENAYEMVDVCGCGSGSGDSPCGPDLEPPEDIPETYQTEAVDMENGAENAFYLAVPNMTGYDNPLSITLKDGAAAPKVDPPDPNAVDAADLATDDITAKGIVIQVPGLETRA